MPAFVIHALGRPPRKVVIDSSPIRVGRDPTADIIIDETSVSREHAMFLVDEKGKWHVSCVSETNPIMVDGAIITSGTLAQEGTEVLVGGSHMIIFSKDVSTANQYMEGKRNFEQGTCEGCKWSGMISAVSKDPKCPRCGKVLSASAAYASDSVNSSEQMDAQQRRRYAVGTEAMPLEQAKDMWLTVKAAKRSHIERVDGLDPEKSKVQLAENKTIEISKRPDAALRLAGFVFGKVVIAWKAPRYMATSELSFASMKVNGKKTKLMQLESGDVIEVGSNRFRFSTGRGGK